MDGELIFSLKSSQCKEDDSLLNFPKVIIANYHKSTVTNTINTCILIIWYSKLIETKNLNPNNIIFTCKSMQI